MVNKILQFKNFIFTSLVLSIMLLVAGCDQQGRGFALPPGDIDQGKYTFTMLRCNECHSISDIKWLGNKDSLNVPLGGKTSRVKTYGELVTSVINPSHKIGEGYKQNVTDEEGKSKMMIYNDIISVQELIDMVTFLQSEYKITAPANDYYPYY